MTRSSPPISPLSWARTLALLLLALMSIGARAEVLDRIEVTPTGPGENEIVIWFLQDVVYLRSVPPGRGQIVRIYFQTAGAGPVDAGPTREIVHGPPSPGVPRFVVTYPEQDLALSVAFAAPVAFRVRQVHGPRSISIFLSGEASSRLQSVEPKVVAAIPDVLPPAKTATTPQGAGETRQQPAGGQPVGPEAAKPLPPVAKTVEPKVVPAIPDVIIATAPPQPAPQPAMPPEAAKAETAAPPAAKPAEAPTPPPVAVAPVLPPPVAAAPPSPPPAGAAAPAAPTTLAQGGAPTTPTRPVPAGPAFGGKALSPSDQEALNRALAASAGTTDDFAPVPLAKVEEVAADLLTQAKAALAANNPKTAVQDLNRLLSLPRNASSQEAQELIGVAWEKSVEIAKARSEYELYLKLYPAGKDTDRVKERIARLPADAERPVPGVAGAMGAAGSEWTITGGISQNFYTGASHIEILTPPPPGQLTFNQTTLSLQDQKALVTSTDLNARRRVDGVETRIAFRDTYTANFLANQKNQDRLSTLYFEQNDRKVGYQYRLGRQSGTFGAVGLFDGAYGAYQVNPDYRISAVVGEPTQFISSPINRNIWGAAVEKQSKLGKPGGTLYFVQQHADGYLDREGVGVEIRYFDERLSGFSMLDYDLAFKQINIAMLQGNWRMNDTGNLYFLVDRRKSPLLQLTNALPAALSPAPLFMPAKNITEALLNSGVSVSELRQWAADTTAQSELYSFGGTQALNETWQLGGDVSMTRISSTNGAGSLPPQPSSGMAKTFNAQVIGNRLLTPNDTDVVNVSYIMAPTYRGQNLTYNHSSTLLDSRWRIDLALRYYHQTDVLNALQSRFNPSLRTSYRVKTNLSFEAEIGGEKVHQEDATGNITDSTRKYFYAGYRWDLQ